MCFARLCSCFRASVHACIRDYMFRRYLQYLWMDFCGTFVIGASWVKDELFRFWGQKVKGQGHSMTKYCPRLYVSTISPVSVDGFSPNFCHWCILDSDDLITFWSRKVRGQGHIATEASSTQCRGWIQLFSVFLKRCSHWPPICAQLVRCLLLTCEYTLTLVTSDIQACCVSPEADIDPCYLADDVPDAVTAFYRVNQVSKFRLDRPFYSGDKSDGDVKVWTLNSQ